jgi:hypothetical protein
MRLPKGGPIFKSVSGELSNLRWDLPMAELPNYYGKSGSKGNATEWGALAALTTGLAGGGPLPRCGAGASLAGGRLRGAGLDPGLDWPARWEAARSLTYRVWSSKRHAPANAWGSAPLRTLRRR